MSRDRLPAIYSRGTWDAVALNKEQVRIDMTTEDGDVVAAILIINDATAFVRDISRAVADAKRMS